MALAAFVAVSASVSALAAGTAQQAAPAKVAIPADTQVPYPGFVGTPMLESNGYTAFAGAFHLEVGQGQTNLENLIDANPDNYATAAGIGATVAIDQICVVTPKTSGSAPTYKSGATIGFVLSDGSNSGSVLNLDVVKLFVVYLYKGQKLVHTYNMQGTELDVLGLSLISYGAGMQTVKLTVPKDKDGNDIEFDGIALGKGGVDANVLEQVRIHYAFVDTLVEVPIIKRYFQGASGKTEGIGVYSGQNMVNNNLNDGAVAAFLNIGGTYYNVYSGEPIPTGLEAGFHMSSGTALNLDLGSAIRLQAIVKDSNGKYKYINLTTGFDVVGLQLAGGGETEITAMIPKDLEDEVGNGYNEIWGLRLELIAGVKLDLGETTVHYAYVKAPNMPEDKTPYFVNMYLLPNATFTHAYRYWENGLWIFRPGHIDFTEHVLLRNSKDKPLKTYELMPNVYRMGVAGTDAPGAHHYAMMSVFRTPVYADGSEGESESAYVGAICVWTDGKKWYYCYQANGQLPSQVTKVEIPGPDANGVIDFGDAELALDTHREEFKMVDNEDKVIASFNYWLYVHENNDSQYKFMATGYELDFGDINVPQVPVSFEIAGYHTLDELKAMDADSAPSDVVKVGEYQNYIEVLVPDMVDYKTVVDGVKIWRHENDNDDTTNEKNAVQYKDGVTIDDGVVSLPDGSSNTINYAHYDDVTKIIFGTEAIAGNSKKEEQLNHFIAEISVKLSDAYSKELSEIFPNKESFPISANYVWKHTAATEQEMPVITHKETSAFNLLLSETESQHMLLSSFNTALNGAADSHAGAGDILYSQWASITPAPEAASAPRRAAAATETVQHTTLNSNKDNYDADTRYTPGRTSQDATLFATHDNEGKVNYNMTTRAYVPVLPSGFTADDIAPSYLVTEAKTDGTTDAPIYTGVEDVTEEAAPAEYYNLQGLRVATPEAGNIYIVRRGATTTKVLF